MKRRLVCFLAVSSILMQVSLCSFANSTNSNLIKIAIKKYRNGNYVGCLQDCQNIVSRDPSNAMAYYYMAISYVQSGQKNKAIQSYGKVLSLHPNGTLAEYATTGKRCLETPDQCRQDQAAASTNPELDKFISSSKSDVSAKAQKDIEQRYLNSIKDEINSGKDINGNDLKRLNNNTQLEETEKKSQTPTNEEIAAALKTLNDAGLNVPTGMVNPYMQNNNASGQDLTQLNMLMGNSNQADNNSMLNMLPYIIAQNKNGVGQQYSQQMMQTMIMGSMMQNVNFNLSQDDNK